MKHRDYFLKSALDTDQVAHFEKLATQSLAKQAEIEAEDNISFEQYLADFYAQYDFPLVK